MNRPTVPLGQHTLAHRIVAIFLSSLIATGAFPASGLASPPVRAYTFHMLPAALPPAQGRQAPQATQPALPLSPEEMREDADNWGEITVAQPKIWQYERVNSLLDGLLRDVEGVSLNDLTNLDPNATNGAAVKFVQSMLEIGVQYNQGAAVTNSIALQNFAASQNVSSAQIAANQTYLQQLYQQRTTVTSQLLAAVQQNATIQGQLATTDPTSAAYPALTTQQQAASSQVTGLQAELTSINSQITAASTATMPTAPAITPTTAPTSPETANTFSSFLGNLPSGLTNNIVSQLQSPSYPATKRLDNFITLLYERLAREISVLQDDVMRDPENVPFLVQFDVGVYPSSQAKNHVGVVEFTMDCDGCKVYSIYPGQSSYNLANYEGTSKRYSFWGALSTIFGFGISGDYRRQTDTLHGDLVQSVYMAGFQEGADSTDRAGDSTKQRFGWYYGSAPFEQLVTPGIRSTFALVSIPRRLLKDCYNAQVGLSSVTYDLLASAKPGIAQVLNCGGGVEVQTDSLGAKDILLDVTAHANWARRNDPYFQKPHWYESKEYVGDIDSARTIHDLKVVLPGTDGILTLPDIALRERQRLHVLGIEYNTVYSTPPAKPGTPAAMATPTPGTTQATATGNGSGTATVTISAAGTASASSTGVGGSTANATATAPPATPAPSSGATPTDAFTGCQQDKCAAVLVKLAEPVDPNLVVTVKGEPLRRVRDWHGRATSILPPAQSASDMPPPVAPVTGAPAAPQRSENVTSASLLEADQLGPNTWMEVDSHRLLINISKDLAGDEEFPPMQIIDPARRALFLPLDLDEGFSEVILNGFHFPARDGGQFKSYVENHFLQNASKPPVTKETEKVTATLVNSLLPAGPYPFETFLPMFLPNPPQQRIYAYLGETGVQILIGFLNNSTDPTSEAPTKSPRWLSSRTQVILEDRDLDLAWSLSCDPQGAELACDVPVGEIGSAYRIVANSCKKGTSDYGACPSVAVGLGDFPSISTLQVWVQQYDPEDTDSFYTPSPAKLGRFPVAVDDTTNAPPDVNFSPWHFETVASDKLTLTGCNYPKFDSTTGSLTVLGTHIPQPYRTPTIRQTEDQKKSNCSSFDIPTIALTHPELVLEYKRGSSFSAPEPLAVARFRPTFGTPVAVPKLAPGANFSIGQWTIDIPVGHVDCNDKLSILDGTNKISAKWLIGAVPLDAQKITGTSTVPCDQEIKNAIEAQAQKAADDTDEAQADLKAAKNDAQKVAKAKADLQAANDLAEAARNEAADVPDWTESSKTSQILLELVISKSDVGSLPLKRNIQILRGKNLNWIGNLPDLRSLLLPTKLTVVNAGTNQFALEGDNAQAIDMVSVQGPGGAINAVSTAAGAQILLVSLPATKTNTKPPAPAKPSIAGFSKDTSAIGSAIEIKGKNFGTGQGSVTFSNNVTAVIQANCWTDTLITVDVPTGTQTGQVTVTIGGAPYKSPKPFTVSGSPVNPAEPITTCKAPAPPSQSGKATGNDADTSDGPKAGTYTVVPLVALGKDAMGNTQYLPIAVTDPDGKPLIYTIVDTTDKKGTTDDSTQVGPATTVTITKKTTQTAPPAKTSTPTPATGATKQ